MSGVVEAALKRQQPPIQRIVYPLKEAATMISVPPTWLAAKARAGEIACVRLGHYITFAENDLKDFADKNRSQLPLPKKKTAKLLDNY
jgi:hypothetical protein